MDNSAIDKTYLKLVNVSKKYSDSFSLTNVNLNLGKGTLVNVVGKKGSGKTSVVRIISGVEKSGFGEIIHPFGDDFKKKTGVLTSDAGFYPDLSAENNIIFFARLYGLSDDLIEDRLRDLFHKLSLWEVKDKNLSGLTTSQKIKLNLARCLMSVPELLICDDILESCNSASAEEIKKLIIDYMSGKGMTVLWFSAKPLDEDMLVNNYAVLHEGEVIATGTAEELRQLSGLKHKLSLRFTNIPVYSDFLVPTDNEFTYEAFIDSDNDSANIINQLVMNGSQLVEAKIEKQSLGSIINTITQMKGGLVPNENNG